MQVSTCLAETGIFYDFFSPEICKRCQVGKCFFGFFVVFFVVILNANPTCYIPLERTFQELSNDTICSANPFNGKELWLLELLGRWANAHFF